MVFKNNPGKEENTHSGSEKKFPWWYFLHTRGLRAGQWGACLHERTAATVYTKTSRSSSLSLSRFSSLPMPPSLITTLSSPLCHLASPPLLVPLIQCFPLSESAVSLCTHMQSKVKYLLIHFMKVFMCFHTTDLWHWTHSHWPRCVLFSRSSYYF